MNKLTQAERGRQIKDACMQMIPECRPFLAAINRDFGVVAWSDCSLPRKMTAAEIEIHCGDANQKQHARDAARIAASQRAANPRENQP